MFDGSFQGFKGFSDRDLQEQQMKNQMLNLAIKNEKDSNK